MTQFVRIAASSSKPSPDDLLRSLVQIDDVACQPCGDGSIWIVSRQDPSSAGPLVDDLHNRIRSHEDVEVAPLVRLLRAVAEHGWSAEFWYSNDSADLPTFEHLADALGELLHQASFQPPEIYLVLQSGEPW